MNCLEDSDLSSSLLRKNQSVGSAVEAWLMPPTRVSTLPTSYDAWFCIPFATGKILKQ